MDCNTFKKLNFCFPLKDTESKLYTLYVGHMHDCKGCEDTYLKKLIADRGYNPDSFCCLTIGECLTFKCDQHPDPWDCPDYKIIKTSGGNYGIPIRNGGSSYCKIDYCPWCGKFLS